MDVHLRSSPQRHYAANGGAGRNSRTGEDDLQSLSQEEKDCIQFFEDTIVSLEKSLKDEDQRPGQANPPMSSHVAGDRVDGPQTMNHIPMSHPSPTDQDIIDLVRQEPDLVPLKQPIFSPTKPDFQRMVQTPEIKPRRDVVDNLPSEYTPTLPSSSYGSADIHSSYHPPGCIPTPVLIAQKIAENKAGGTSNLLSSSLHRRQSMESEKPQSYSSDLPAKQGPPTSAKPNRFPANINVIHTSKDHLNQSGANVNIQERRTQMLANLTGTSHPLVQEDPQHSTEQMARHTPTRSISFKDPTPDISRMEALSKLGLNMNRKMSVDVSLPSSSTTFDALPVGQPSAKPLEASVRPTTETSAKANVTRSQSQIHADRKSEILRTDSRRSLDDRNPRQNLSSPAVTKSSFNPPLEHNAPVIPPPEVASLEFNSYGGKSIVVQPSVFPKSEPATSPTSPDLKNIPHVLSKPSEFNTYGGKTKVMNPASGATTRNNLPDILSSHIDKSQTLPSKPEPLPAELNSYGGKSRTINPSSGLSHSSEGQTKSFKAPAPTTAPKPQRHTIHVTAPRPAPRPPSPERRRSGSLFRPQGITVQFSGRGPMNDSRREALRKLGLLKDS